MAVGVEAPGKFAPGSIPVAAGGAVTGTMAATEAADTASISGAIASSGTLAATEGTDTAAISGTVFTGISGTLAVTEAADTAAVAGSIASSGTLSATEATDTASISGVIASSGSLTATEANDTAAISGTVSQPITGTLAASESPDVCAVAASVPVTQLLGGGTGAGQPVRGGGSSSPSHPNRFAEDIRRANQPAKKRKGSKSAQETEAAEADRQIAADLLRQIGHTEATAKRLSAVVGLLEQNIRAQRIMELQDQLAQIQQALNDEEDAVIALLLAA